MKRSRRSPQPMGPSKTRVAEPAPLATAPAPPPERAMGDEELEVWLAARHDLKPWARNLSMVDGFVAAVVCGPVSLHPHAWINPLLAIGPQAWDTGGTLEFAAIKAVSNRHNATSECLVEGRPYAPVFRHNADGGVDRSDWCEGFRLCVNLSRRKWKDLLDVNSVYHGLLSPILHDSPISPSQPSFSQPSLRPIPPGRGTEQFLKDTNADIPGVVATMRKHFQLQRFGKPHPDTLVGRRT
jgi:uncharacterized protein